MYICRTCKDGKTTGRFCRVCGDWFCSPCMGKHVHNLIDPSLKFEGSAEIIEKGRVWKFLSSSSKKGKTHKTLLRTHSESLELSCSCPSWIFQKKPSKQRDCKHTKEIKQLINPTDRNSIEAFGGNDF